jgi:hypothetical protein
MALNRRSSVKMTLDTKDPRIVHEFTPEKYFGAHQDPHAWESRYRAILRNGLHLEEGIIRHPYLIDTFFYNDMVYILRKEALNVKPS